MQMHLFGRHTPPPLPAPEPAQWARVFSLCENASVVRFDQTRWHSASPMGLLGTQKIGFQGWPGESSNPSQSKQKLEVWS